MINRRKVQRGFYHRTCQTYKNNLNYFVRSKFFSLSTKNVFISAAIFFSNSAFSLSLSEAVERSFEKDPEFLSEKQSYTAAKELEVISGAALLPNISLQSNFTKIENSLNVSTETQNYGVTLNQSIYNKTLLLNDKQNKLLVDEAEFNFLKARETLIIKITSSYFDVLVAQNNLKTIRAEKKAVAEQLEFAKRNFEVGTSTITDQQEAQARFDLIRASEIKTENDLAITRTNLEKHLLRPLPKSLMGINSQIKLQELKFNSPLEWMKLARKNNFNVKAARIRKKIAEVLVDKQRSSRIPTLSASISSGHNTTDAISNSTSESHTISLNLTAPIYLGGSISSKTRQAIANLTRAQQLLELTLLNVDRKAGESYRSVVAGLSQVEALEAAENSSKVALESNKLGYEVGVRINIDVLNAQRQLFSTQRDLATARYDVLRSQFQLLESVGELSLTEVQKISRIISKSN
ncbi:MAG: hypothetical protein CBC42_04050 [Betaproteobacteria bacterium TMED82]|nr:MAG: hypothetical protein CBC42_04050 [Betaproteobacteria bacterium TMED82]|tara:strand:+ start:33020 stop:34411 length:1392 start_codon:yes stop_codon:yes gene_type:complete